MTRDVSQLDRFKEAAREIECDDDKARFDATLKKIAPKKSEYGEAGESTEGEISPPHRS
jgi:hypothetical protein